MHYKQRPCYKEKQDFSTFMSQPKLSSWRVNKQAVIYRRSWPQVKKLAAVAVANGDIIGRLAEPAAS